MRARRVSRFWPDHIRGIEVLPSLSPEAVARAKEIAEYEFWRRIIPPLPREILARIPGHPFFGKPDTTEAANGGDA